MLFLRECIVIHKQDVNIGERAAVAACFRAVKNQAAELSGRENFMHPRAQARDRFPFLVRERRSVKRFS